MSISISIGIGVSRHSNNIISITTTTTTSISMYCTDTDCVTHEKQHCPSLLEGCGCGVSGNGAVQVDSRVS
jgi:hypothetical protein